MNDKKEISTEELAKHMGFEIQEKECSIKDLYKRLNDCLRYKPEEDLLFYKNDLSEKRFKNIVKKINKIKFKEDDSSFMASKILKSIQKVLNSKTLNGKELKIVRADILALSYNINEIYFVIQTETRTQVFKDKVKIKL